MLKKILPFLALLTPLACNTTTVCDNFSDLDKMDDSGFLEARSEAIKYYRDEFQNALGEVNIYRDPNFDCDTAYMLAHSQENKLGCITVCETYEEDIDPNATLRFLRHEFYHILDNLHGVPSVDGYDDFVRWYLDDSYGTPEENQFKVGIQQDLYANDDIYDMSYGGIYKDIDILKGRDEYARICSNAPSVSPEEFKELISPEVRQYCIGLSSEYQ